MLRAESYNQFGSSISMSSDSKTVTAGTQHNDDSGKSSSHAKVLTYSYNATKWNPLGNTMLVKAKSDVLGFPFQHLRTVRLLT